MSVHTLPKTEETVLICPRRAMSAIFARNGLVGQSKFLPVLYKMLKWVKPQESKYKLANSVKIYTISKISVWGNAYIATLSYREDGVLLITLVHVVGCLTDRFYT